jgi:uncharacterized membrane protein YheB (UPF0754 family)
MNIKENINKRLLKEIEEIDDKENIKKFLEELLTEENYDSFGYAYKEEYRKIVNKFLNEKKSK